MGRIKTKMIKRVTKDLLKEHEPEFSEDYESNKRLVDNMAEIQSKKLRNIIAGYVTRLVKTREKF